MAIDRSAGVASPLGELWNGGAIGSALDEELIDRFLAGRLDAAEAAFDVLVRRHGPMVLRVCREVLGNAADAEDAFQMTFLVLIRRAWAIRRRGSLASWLHGVAVRIARRACADAARRRTVEGRHAASATHAIESPGPPMDAPIIHDEFRRLPEKYRAPIVLCGLQGLTHEEAARRLGWPVGSVSGRLSRGRDLLRTRLSRRGLTELAALAAVGSLSAEVRAAVPASLGRALVRSAARVFSGQSLAAVVPSRVASSVELLSTASEAFRGIAIACAILGLALGAGGLALGFPAVGLRVHAPETGTQAAPAQDSREERSKELRAMLQLRGTWSARETVERTVGGVRQPPELEKLTWSIDRDTITSAGSDGFASWTYRFSLDPEQSPKHIELKSLNVGLQLHGIYKLEGESLTICWGTNRPSEFRTTTDHILITFKKEARTPVELSPRIPNAPGCYWAAEPAGAVPSSMTNGIVNYIVRKDAQGAMVVSLASNARLEGGEPDVEYRPVAIDVEKGRHLFEGGEGGWGEAAQFRGVALRLAEFRLDPRVLPFDRVQSLGIEVVPAEVRKGEKPGVQGAAPKP